MILTKEEKIGIIDTMIDSLIAQKEIYIQSISSMSDDEKTAMNEYFSYLSKQIVVITEKIQYLSQNAGNLSK